jgi:hypothetical protein
MLPMLPNAGTEKIVSCSSSQEVYIQPSLWNDVLKANLGVFLSLQLKCAHLVPAKAPLSEEAIFNHKKAVVEERRDARKAQHKKRQIAKRDRNDNRTKRRKAGELGVSSDEDPSPEPSCSGDVASATIDLLTDKRRIPLRSASVRTHTFFTTGFPRFLSIRGARGLQALIYLYTLATQNLTKIKLENN